jgi:hypothetical protein
MRGAAGAILCVVILSACSGQKDGPPGPCEVAQGPVPLPELPETSGLAVSRRDPAVLWSHNDSGNAAVLFALDTAGAVRGRVRVPINARDWEDVSAGSCPAGNCLYIGDIGDNRGARERFRIYRVPEPAIGDEATAAPEIYTAAYADGPHNAEAMFVAGDDLFIVTKDRVGGVYRASTTGSRDLTFQRIGQLGLAAVTDAEASRDEQSVAVRTSREVILYRAEELRRGGNIPFLRIPVGGLREAQGEGIALDGSMLYLSSEGGAWSPAGTLLTLRCKLSP